MDALACAATAVACTASLAVGMASASLGPGAAVASGVDSGAALFASVAGVAAPTTTGSAGATVQAAPAATPDARVFMLPEPSGDPARDLRTLQAAVNDARYDIIDGAAGGRRQAYTIQGMLEIGRSVTIRNLEINQLDADYVVRTIYAAGGGAPITLRLDNIKILRGPEGSEASGSISDSAGIWTVNVRPEFSNVEIVGGGKGHGVHIVNASGGYLTDVYVHDITWTPYPQDFQDAAFWGSYRLATLQQMGNWNGFTIWDFDGRALAKRRIEEQVDGIVLNNVYDLKIVRPRIERLMTRFSDGQLYPYQSDGITIVSGNDISIENARISNVAEGFDVPGFPARNISISGAEVSDAPLFCFKTRGSYEAAAASVAADAKVVTVTNSTGVRCGIAAFSVAAGGEALLQDTRAIDTGLGPGNAAPGIGGVAAYRFFRSDALPNLDGASRAIGMHIVNATISNPNSRFMQTAFHSENTASDRRTEATVRNYALSNPLAPNVRVSTNFTSVVKGAMPAT